MKKLPGRLINVFVIVLVLAIVAGGIVYFLSGSSSKKVSAQFSSAVGLYPGTPVDILGVEVGKVTKVSPEGSHVTVEMQYDSTYSLPSNAIAVTVANSLVSDRYVQLAPAYKGSGPKLADGATIPNSRTAAPAELDDIYSALDRLTTALGPQGANKNGALSRLVTIGAANLKGNGAALGNSIGNLSQAVKTLADNRGNLFGTVRHLQVFSRALSDSDLQIKRFNEQLAQVSGDLASERGDLGAALHNLGIALNTVAGFVRDNESKFHTDVKGLRLLSQILVNQSGALNEILSIAPVALANVVHAYQPNIGALGTRSNLASLTDPANLCQVLSIGGFLDPITKLLGPVTKTVGTVCKKVLSNLPDGSKLKLPTGLTPAQLKKLLGGLLNGGGSGLGGIITGGA